MPQVVSVIIPARNEETHVERCVRSVTRELGGLVEHEVIVVDNRSTDRTRERALANGAAVIASTARTIGAVRNGGVASSRGDVLVFLDADCYVGEGWGRGMLDALDLLVRKPATFVGSHPAPPKDERVFLWDYWFAPYVSRQSDSHLGSAHLVCTRAVFDSLGGFSESLATGEDYDLCRRLVQSGGDIVPASALVAFHDGYPRTVAQFFRREMWHGAGDFRSVGDFVRSKVAIAALAFSLTALSAIALALASQGRAAVVAAGMSLAVLVVSAVARFRGYPLRTAVVASACVLPIYLVARGSALVRRAGRWR